jgi:hypothetical protein
MQMYSQETSVLGCPDDGSICATLSKFQSGDWRLCLPGTEARTIAFET